MLQKYIAFVYDKAWSVLIIFMIISTQPTSKIDKAIVSKLMSNLIWWDLLFNYGYPQKKMVTMLTTVHAGIFVQWSALVYSFCIVLVWILSLFEYSLFDEYVPVILSPTS